MFDIKKNCKQILQQNNCLMWNLLTYRKKVRQLLSRNVLKINNRGGCYKIKKMVRGANNCLVIGAGSFLNNVSIHIIGKDNVIEFGERVRIGKNCRFWIEGNHCKIIVDDNTTFTQKVHFNVQEDNSEIVCGKDCMFSNMIIVRTSDSHAIWDMKTQKRINPAKNVNIGDHVWIAPNSTIMKGVTIGSNTIIGSHTLVTKSIPDSVLAVGMPAKVIKENITWSREDIIFNK